MTAAFAAFGLTSPVTQAAAPFMIGHAFKKGEIPAGYYVAPDLANVSVVPLCTWNDGSLKHAAIIGRAPLTADVQFQVNLLKTITAPSAGTLLTAASIQAAAPSVTVQCGAYGTVSLAALLATPKRTFISTKEMVECHYTAKVGSDASLYVKFYVRLFLDGRMRVDVIVGNGYLNGTEIAVKNYVPTVTVSGSVAYNNAGASLKHYPKARYNQTFWVGADPQVTPRHDTGYLNRTKLIPNYWKGSPSQTQIDRWSAPTTETSVSSSSSFLADNPYLPFNNCNYTPYMPGQGFQEQLGLLPNWEAQYCTSGAHPVLYEAMIRNARAANSYGIGFVDVTNHDPIRISDFPTWSGDGVGGSGGVPVTGRRSNDEGLVWEIAHSGGMGYLAYLQTANFLHLETCIMNANCVYLQESTLRGNGVDRGLVIQNRGMAWSFRNLAQASAIYPASMSGLFGDVRTFLKNQVSAAYQKYVATTLPAPWLGMMDFFNSRAYTSLNLLNGRSFGGELVAGTAPFEHHFTTMSVAMAADIEALDMADMPKLIGVRDYVLGMPVAFMGGSGATEFNFGYQSARQAVNIPVSAAQNDTFEAVPISLITATNPGDIFRATFKAPYVCFPGSAQIADHFATLQELPCDAAVFTPSVLASPITLTYHTDSGNGYITGFPSVSVVVTYSNTSTTTFSAGANVPYVDGAVMSFQGIRVLLSRYGGLPVNGEQFTITANTPPLSTGENPATNVLTGLSGGSPSIAFGYEANMLPSLSYAVDGGKAGAAAAWARFTQASNFSAQDVTANYADTPVFGIAPRSYSQPAMTFTPIGSNADPEPPGAIVTTPGPSSVFDSASLLGAGAVVFDSHRGLGVPLTEVPTGGTDGTCTLRAMIEVGDNPLSEIRWWITRAPAHGVLTLDGVGGWTYVASNTPPLDDSFDFATSVDGAAAGTAGAGTGTIIITATSTPSSGGTTLVTSDLTLSYTLAALVRSDLLINYTLAPASVNSAPSRTVPFDGGNRTAPFLGGARTVRF